MRRQGWAEVERAREDYANGRFVEALATLLLAGQTGHPWQWVTAAWCYDAQGDRERALGCYERAVREKCTPSSKLAAELGLQRPQPWRKSPCIEDLTDSLAPSDDWRATASHRPEVAALALDGRTDTRWESGAPQQTGMWFRVDFPEPLALHGLVLDDDGGGTSPYRSDYPRRAVAQVLSLAGKWARVEFGAGSLSEYFVVAFQPVHALAARVTLTEGCAPEWWSIYRAILLGEADDTGQPFLHPI